MLSSVASLIWISVVTNDNNNLMPIEYTMISILEDIVDSKDDFTIVNEDAYLEKQV